MFVQIGDRPLMTVNGKHLLSDALGYCGARNVFAAAPALVPTVDREGVLAAAPDVILLVADAADERAWADAWRSWNRRTGGGPGIAVASAGRLASFSPRVLEGLRDMCAELQRHRRS